MAATLPLPENLTDATTPAQQAACLRVAVKTAELHRIEAVGDMVQQQMTWRHRIDAFKTQIDGLAEAGNVAPEQLQALEDCYNSLKAQYAELEQTTMAVNNGPDLIDSLSADSAVFLLKSQQSQVTPDPAGVTQQFEGLMARCQQVASVETAIPKERQTIVDRMESMLDQGQALAQAASATPQAGPAR
jgi:hypothetical protein